MTTGTTNETTVSITDDDTANFVISTSSVSVQEGGTTDFTVRLATKPTHNVTVTVESNDTAAATVSIGSLTFTSTNWDSTQTVTVSGVEDSDADDKIVTISMTAASTDTDYDEMSASVTATVIDDDIPNLVADPTTLTVTEDGSRQFTVKLATLPSDGVNVTVESGDTGAATVSAASLSFTTANWNAAQTVTVSGVDDNDTANESVTVSLTAASTDEDYGGKTASVTVTVTDDDTPNLVVDPISLTVGESGTTTFTVKLGTQPTRDVSVTITSDDTGAATVSPTPLTFTPTLTFAGKLWSTTQTVTVYGVSDSDTSDEDVTVTVSASGGGYNNATSSVSVTVTDDDEIPVTVKFEHATHSVTEGGTVVVRVQLSEDPERTVTVPITKDNQDGATDADYSGVPASVTFNSGDTSKEFTFSATDDTIDDDGESLKLGFGNLPADVSAGTPNESVVSIVDNDDPAVTVGFASSTYTVAEGGTVTVTVTLSADPERTVTIPLTKDNQDGASSADYSGVPASVVFNSGDTEKSFTFTATSDTVDDDGESIKLTFGSTLPTGVTEGSTNETVVSITDDDVPSVTVSFERGTYTVAEGASTTVKVTLSADPERTVTIPITKDNQDGASSADYSGVPASVVFNSGDTEKEFTFTATQDSVDDDGESVKLGFGPSLPTGVTEGTTNETVVSITDDDVPAVTVRFEQDTYTVAEGASTTVKLLLSAAPEREVEITILKANQEGATAFDYSGVPTTVTFSSTDTEKSFTFSATSDSEDDDGESVKLTISTTLPDGVIRGTPNETTVSITDDDVPAVTVSFASSTYTVAEGNTVTVTVTLSADPERTVTIPITKGNQDGATNADYSGVPSSVVFNSGDTEKEFTFTATQDSVDDDGESVKLGFGPTLPTGVTEGSTNETVVSITDDDTPGSITVNFGAGTYGASEGGSTQVSVTLSEDPERTVEISLGRTNLGGASNSDYSGVPATLTFNSGDTEREFTFTAQTDLLVDPGEKVKLTFGTLPQGVAAGTTSETTVSILEVSPQSSLSVSFGAPDHTVNEGNSVTITVNLDQAPGSEVQIPITTANQEGASAADYSGVPASITFGATDTQKTFTFTATQDTVDDDGESVKLGFDTLPTGVTEGTTNETVVSITDDDVPSVTVSFATSSYTVAEGNTVTVTVTLSADPERTVTIPITKDNQDGASSADYSGVPASVVFNSSDTEKSFTFSATDDTADDDGESVKLGFGNTLPTGVTAGTTNETTVSITEDDVPSVTVSFATSSYTVAEGNTVTVTVTLSADPERTVTIPITKDNQDGASSADYSGVPASVVFNSSDTEKSFTFSATDDTADDDGESVKLGFGNTLPTGVTAGTTNETTVSITEDDVPSVTVRFEQDNYTAAEGASTTVKLLLSAAPERELEITLLKANQDGATASDYSGVPSTVTFSSTDTEKSFTFNATQDTVDDDGESVKLTISATLPDSVTRGTPGEATVNITDDDATVQPQVSVQVSFEAPDYALSEGRTTDITVQLSQDPERTVIIPITTTPGAGLTSDDYSGVPQTVVFNSGDTEKSFSFTAVQDTVDEDQEELTLGFGTLPDGVTSESPAQASVAISDSTHVSFGAPGYTAHEGGESATVTVNLDQPATVETVIPITATGMNGATSDDWTGAPTTLTFATGDTQKTFILRAYDDTIEDDGESVVLGFGILPVGVAPGSPRHHHRRAHEHGNGPGAAPMSRRQRTEDCVEPAGRDYPGRRQPVLESKTRPPPDLHCRALRKRPFGGRHGTGRVLRKPHPGQPTPDGHLERRPEPDAATEPQGKPSRHRAGLHSVGMAPV